MNNAKILRMVTQKELKWAVLGLMDSGCEIKSIIRVSPFPSTSPWKATYLVFYQEEK